jgi:hypothetical protein
MEDKPRSGVAGVVCVLKCKKWSASIGIDNKHHHLGLFNNLDEAVMARYSAEENVNRELYIGYSPAKRYLIKKGLIKEK